MRWLACGAGLAGLTLAAQAQPRDFVPASDATVLDHVPVRPRTPVLARLGDPQEAIRVARHWITASRQQSEPRHLGRAQAALAPWAGRADAPADIQVLQATILQRQHRFGEAHALLTQALQRQPGHAEGWLTLATLERLAGRYAQALRACAAVAQAGATAHAEACQWDIRSLQGQQVQARAGFTRLLAARPEPGFQAWVLSLLGESEERAGHDTQAHQAFTRSLQLDPDPYTAVALADLLLRQGRPGEALAVLQGQPPSVAVLLRRARALRAQGDPAWRALRDDVRATFTQQRLRGDDPVAEARERAWAAWWLQDDAALAMAEARLNLAQQREPIDWWLALASAQRLGQRDTAAQWRVDLQRSGLMDVRLAAKALP